MRRGFKGQILKNTEGKVIGVFFGSDFCAEHEWGVEDLLEAVAIYKGEQQPKPWHVGETNYKVFENVLGDNGEYYNAIFFGEGMYVHYFKPESAFKNVCEYLLSSKDNGNCDNTFTAWDRHAFGVLFPVAQIAEFTAVKSIIDSKEFNIGFIQRKAENNPFSRSWGLAILAEGCENDLEGFEIIK